MQWVTIGRALAAGAVAAAIGLSCGMAAARPAGAASATVAMQALPPEGQQVHRLVRQGGPFPYPHKDGRVFANREQLLPRMPRGYYREYTVPTPAARDRGARRLVCGGRKPTIPEVCYYTQDHYASFSRVAE